MDANQTDPKLNPKEVLKEAGVADLTPIKVRGYFAKAVIAERNGDHDLANSLLNTAVAEEIASQIR